MHLSVAVIIDFRGKLQREYDRSKRAVFELIYMVSGEDE